MARSGQCPAPGKGGWGGRERVRAAQQAAEQPTAFWSEAGGLSGAHTICRANRASAAPNPAQGMPTELQAGLQLCPALRSGRGRATSERRR